MALFPLLAKTLKESYATAITTGAVKFTNSDVHDLDDGGIPFEIRFAPSLAKKPTRDDVENETNGAAVAARIGSAVGDERVALKERRNPFVPPYDEGLLIAEGSVPDGPTGESDDFVLLLNKYPLTPRHFLLCTKEFVPQSSPLTPSELYATYSILTQLGTREKFLAFFNCGRESGASLQFIPLPNGIAPFDDFIATHRPSNAKPNAPFQLPLPYANFTCLLSPAPLRSSASAPTAEEDAEEIDRIGSYLVSSYLSLLDLMISHLRQLSLRSNSTPTPNPTPNRRTPISYNLIITSTYMHLVPRSLESYPLPTPEGEGEGPKAKAEGEGVSINALGFAGMLLVKKEEAIEAIRKVGVLQVLKSVGVEMVMEGQMDEEDDGGLECWQK